MQLASSCLDMMAGRWLECCSRRPPDNRCIEVVQRQSDTAVSLMSPCGNPEATLGEVPLSVSLVSDFHRLWTGRVVIKGGCPCSPDEMPCSSSPLVQTIKPVRSLSNIKMRFVSSFALLSLAGLGLATPLHPREDVTGDQAAAAGAAYGTDALGGLTGGLGALGLRDEEHKDKHKGYGHGVHRRQDDGGSDSGEGHGVLLRGEHDEDHKEEHKGYPHGVHRRQDDGGSDSGEGHGVLLRTRGEYDEEEGSHEGDGEGEGEGEGEHKEKPKPKSKGKEKGKGKKGKGKGKGKDGKGKSHESKGKCNDARHTPCLHPDDVDVLINAYVRMLSKWNDTDAKYLADSFRDTSDSINILAGIPLGNPTFPTKQAFIDHQHTQVCLSAPSACLLCEANAFRSPTTSP